MAIIGLSENVEVCTNLRIPQLRKEEISLNTKISRLLRCCAPRNDEGIYSFSHRQSDLPLPVQGVRGYHYFVILAKARIQEATVNTGFRIKSAMADQGIFAFSGTLERQKGNWIILTI